VPPVLIGALVAVSTVGVGRSQAFAADPFPAHVGGDASTHDPSLVIRPSPPRYIVNSTGNETRVFTDRSQLDRTVPALLPPPLWWRAYNPQGIDWAPDVSFHDGQYWMYYAVSSFGSNRSVIGLALSLSAEPGSWIDQGMVFSSKRGDSFNAIDPNLVVDPAGNWWLTFGSFWNGIFMISLDPATGKLPSVAPTLTPVAARPAVPQNPIESSFVYQHGGYYHLFVSFDYCCRGSASTYSIHVGRSTSPTGPYVDRNGTPMLNGGGTTVLHSHDWVRGPGGQSVVHDDADNRDLLVYHYYDARDKGKVYLGINVLGWDANGWPYVR
jgi:arabinan endo-1,5-alpha-L-arabinosidase